MVFFLIAAIPAAAIGPTRRRSRTARFDKQVSASEPVEPLLWRAAV